MNMTGHDTDKFKDKVEELVRKQDQPVRKNFYSNYADMP
jgi:hypothetical protein